MAERYSRLFSMSGQLYAEGSPVIIAAGALLNDHATGKVLAQLKFRNVSLKQMKALRVEIIAGDTVGRDLGSPVYYQYLDLNVDRDQEFGQKNAIYLPDPSSRGMRVRVLEAAFSDHSLWTAEEDLSWDILPEPEALFADDKELLKQYRLDINREAKQEHLIVKDLWICSCGAVNRREEEQCHCCETRLSEMRDLDIDHLKESCEARLAEEEARKIAEEKKAAEEQAERERIAAEREKARQQELELKKKKIAKIEKLTALGIAILLLVLLIISKVVVPAVKYRSAEKLLEEEKYTEAAEAFEGLGNYRDSASMAGECRNRILYENAKDCMETQDYAAAIEKFKLLVDFQDSAALLDQCKPLLYKQAIKKIMEQDYKAAKESLSLIPDYEDSEQWLYMAKGITEYNNRNFKEACGLFEKVDGKYAEANKEFYEGWLSAAMFMDIFSREKITIEDALKLSKQIPESHSADNKEFFDSLTRLQKCAGTYVYKPERNGPYKMTVQYGLERGSVKAYLTYENFTGSFDEPGDVAVLQGDKEYDFIINITGTLSYSQKEFTIRINPEHAHVQGPSVYWSDDCYREKE